MPLDQALRVEHNLELGEIHARVGDVAGLLSLHSPGGPQIGLQIGERYIELPAASLERVVAVLSELAAAGRQMMEPV